MNKKQKSQVIWGAIIVIAIAVGVIYSATRPTYEGTAGPRPFKGGEQAEVVVEEFSDFQCPACGAAYPLLKAVADTYGDQIRFEYNHYPLTRIHPNAMNAALASECANDQGKFWEMHDMIFEHQRDLSKSVLKTLASDLDLDIDAFNACLDSRAYKDIVEADIQEGNERGVNATPTIYVNGAKRSPSDIYDVIDKALAETID